MPTMQHGISGTMRTLKLSMNYLIMITSYHMKFELSTIIFTLANPLKSLDN